MIKMQIAANQIIIDYEVYDKRPTDSAPSKLTKWPLGRTPSLVATDAAFYSDKNERAAKAKGLKRVCIPNRLG
jgi:transposase, IS5 family